jgi:hypothetical protein
MSEAMIIANQIELLDAKREAERLRKIIDLAFYYLREGSKYANKDDVNGDAGCICRDGLDDILKELSK